MHAAHLPIVCQQRASGSEIMQLAWEEMDKSPVLAESAISVPVQKRERSGIVLESRNSVIPTGSTGGLIFSDPLRELGFPGGLP